MDKGEITMNLKKDIESLEKAIAVLPVKPMERLLESPEESTPLLLAMLDEIFKQIFPVRLN